MPEAEAFSLSASPAIALQPFDAAVLPSIGDAATEAEAMLIAVRLARRGPGGGANPQVGCVILASHSRGSDESGAAHSNRRSAAQDTSSPAGPGTAPRQILGMGWHEGAGTPHAEVAALASAANAEGDVRGATAIVTLQPCNSHGRTGPCARALAEAGVARVLYAVADPAATGAKSDEYLRTRGIEVIGQSLLPARFTRPLAAAEQLALPWLTATRRGRPYVTLKQATSLDGRIAAPDGTSQWITGSASRAHAHRIRTQVGAIVVGTGTALADDPSLTARDGDGGLARHQPLRVVMGLRPLPPGGRLHGDGGMLVPVHTRDPRDVLTELTALGVTHALVEGGAHIAAAFLRAGLVDEVHSYIAPLLLGADAIPALGSAGVTTLADAPRLRVVDVQRLGEDVLVVSRQTTSREGN